MSSSVEMEALRAAKRELRRSARARIAAMSEAQRASADAEIGRRLLAMLETLEVSFVVAYLALPDEAHVENFLVGAARRGLSVLAPVVERKGEFALGAWAPGIDLLADGEGVPSPPAGAARPPGRGLVVVPGRVFDTEGGRIGRGLGYYDRFLSERPAIVVGVAYECQVVERVPREAHDAAMDCLVTEAQLRDFRRGDRPARRKEERE